ncbi:hypothetical protein [Streptantibioticus silvisoli]|uniref:Uncharacterized protein n=1 Tax=Streptantibioticus silvisoli TaxID=2705255 RepID=A0ABT6VWW9_9ACTN|nr:hypothetical protein [Streptantibioticus silvisoli]MDI5962982.1 hypothetical protein [Streptantibioticus silvisoli]
MRWTNWRACSSGAPKSCSGSGRASRSSCTCPSPRDIPLAVHVGDYESADDNEPHFRYALGLDEPAAVEAPLIEDFPVPTLGPRKKAVRYAKDDGGGIIASVRYAWGIQEHGLFAVTDPRRVMTAMEDVDRLCKGLRYLSEDEFPE